MRNKILIAGVICLTAVGATSCSMANGLFGKKVEKEAVLPLDREQVSQPQKLPLYTSADIARGILAGDWAIETVNGKPAVGETAPFLRFVPDDKRVYGNNGCNIINASYTYNPNDSTVSFSQIISTMMACDKEGITDYEINGALDAARSYAWQLGENEYTVTLFNENHTPIMELMHQNFDFLNGTWSVTFIGDKAIANPKMKLVFDVDEQKLHGNTGCNILNGKFETDMDAPNSISFSALATTRMACPDQDEEMQLIVALEDASSARMISADTVYLFNSAGERVLVLQRSKE